MIGVLGAKTAKVVAQQYDLNAKPKKQSKPVVQIRGRAPGLMGMIMSAMGIGQSTLLTVTKDEARFESSSLSGRNISVIPLASVSSVESGYVKPIAMIFTAISTFISGMGVLAGAPRGAKMPIFMIFGVISVVMIISYFFSKTFHVTVHGEGSVVFRLLLKKSAVPGTALNENLTIQTLGILRDVVIAAKAGVGGGTVESSGGGAFSRAAAAPAYEDELHYEDEPEEYVEAIPMEDDETVAANELARAKKLYQDGHKDEAIKLLRMVASRYPDTDAGHTAKKNLERI